MPSKHCFHPWLGHVALWDLYTKVPEGVYNRCPAPDADVAECVATDEQTITVVLIAVINSLPCGGEHVQFYQAVQHGQSAAQACVDKDKYTLRNSEGDPAAYKG